MYTASVVEQRTYRCKKPQGTQSRGSLSSSTNETKRNVDPIGPNHTNVRAAAAPPPPAIPPAVTVGWLSLTIPNFPVNSEKSRRRVDGRIRREQARKERERMHPERIYAGQRNRRRSAQMRQYRRRKSRVFYLYDQSYSLVIQLRSRGGREKERERERERERGLLFMYGAGGRPAPARDREKKLS